MQKGVLRMSKFIIFIAASCFSDMALAQAVMTDIVRAESVLVKNHQVMNELNPKYDFGVLLGELNNWVLRTNPDAVRGQGMMTPGAFVMHMFDAAYNQQNDHEAAPVSKQLGAPIFPG